MAKHCNSLLRGLRGRIGNTIFYRNGDQDCIRSYPLEYHDANTPEQQKNRAHLTVALRFYQQLKETLLKEVWKSEGHRLKTNGYALFMKKNFHVFTPEGKIADFSRLQIGIGRRQDVNNMTHSIDPEDKVTLQWDDNSGSPSAKATDRLIVVVLYGNRSFTPVVLDKLPFLREDEIATFSLQRKKGIKAHIYCFFASQDDKYFSNDKYFKL